MKFFSLPLLGDIIIVLFIISSVLAEKAMKHTGTSIAVLIPLPKIYEIFISCKHPCQSSLYSLIFMILEIRWQIH
jgi:hypothetical protein